MDYEYDFGLVCWMKFSFGDVVCDFLDKYLSPDWRECEGEWIPYNDTKSNKEPYLQICINCLGSEIVSLE
jgi:hypothetical protein